MSDFQTAHSVQAVGDVTITYTRIGTNGNSPISLQGYKLASQFLNAEQIVDNSIVIPILGGGSVQLTNTNLSGTLTFNCTRVSSKLTDGDIVTIAQAQQSAADSDGATIEVSFGFNGSTFMITFYKCTVKRCPPIILAGNDAPDYSVQYNYGYFKVGVTADPTDPPAIPDPNNP